MASKTAAPFPEIGSQEEEEEEQFEGAPPDSLVEQHGEEEKAQGRAHEGGLLISVGLIPGSPRAWGKGPHALGDGWAVPAAALDSP